MRHICSKTVLAAHPILACVWLLCFPAKGLGARWSWDRLQTKGRKGKRASCLILWASTIPPAINMLCGRDAPINAATAIMQVWLVAVLVEHPLAAALLYCYGEPCFTEEILSLAAPIHFRTLRVSRSKRRMASKARKHRCWEIQEGGSSKYFNM